MPERIVHFQDPAESVRHGLRFRHIGEMQRGFTSIVQIMAASSAPPM